MKRTKIGDVYAFKSERGYRILQWAYNIEKMVKYVRVFPNFYQEIPEDIEKIVSSECAYIIGFPITRLYRTGLLELIYSAPIDTIPPFPKYDINYNSYGEEGRYYVCEFECHQHFEAFDGYPDGRGLPEKYKNLKLVNGYVDPTWFIYLLTSDFDLQHWDLFYPGKYTHSVFLEKYGKQLFGSKYDGTAIQVSKMTSN